VPRGSEKASPRASGDWSSGKSLVNLVSRYSDDHHKARAHCGQPSSGDTNAEVADSEPMRQQVRDRRAFERDHPGGSFDESGTPNREPAGCRPAGSLPLVLDPTSV
jgi:hypothetical protein